MAHILVTGGNGYIGSHLVSQLLEQAHQVTAVDWMAFGRHPLAAHADNPKFRLLCADVRSLKPETINAVDAVCDLAAIDVPASDFDAAIVKSVNHLARRRLGLLAKALGVKRYLLASSIATTDAESVDSTPERLAEQSLLALDDDEFTVTVLRLGCAFGLSRRMRFDLPLNALTQEACRSRKVVVTDDHTAAQATIHAADAAGAFVQALALPAVATQGRILEVFSDRRSLPELAGIVVGTLPFKVELSGASPFPAAGRKSHCFEKGSGNELLLKPTAVTAQQAVMEMYIALSSGRTHPSFVTRTANVYSMLVAEGRLTATRFLEPLPRRRHAS